MHGSGEQDVHSGKPEPAQQVSGAERFEYGAHDSDRVTAYVEVTRARRQAPLRVRPWGRSVKQDEEVVVREVKGRLPGVQVGKGETETLGEMGHELGQGLVRLSCRFGLVGE